MNNFLRVMAIDEKDMHRVTFVTPREEGGINVIFDPEANKFAYQVFIHTRLPYCAAQEWLFKNFADARSFAARKFDADWEMLSWDQNVKRPCADGGTECGSGSCATCQELKNMPAVEGAPQGSGCGGCGHG